MSSTIFFRNLTCLDHAYITGKGLIEGCSFNVSCAVTGDITSGESVVVDFSLGKKLLKNLIDDRDNGYDHKLLIYPSVKSRGVVTDSTNSLVSHYMSMSSNSNSFKILVHEDLQDELSQYLTTSLSKVLNLSVSVDVSLSQTGFSDNTASYFTYVHGLKNSTSYGCQNLNHGHRSFVESSNKKLQKEVAKYLNGAILINKENIIKLEEDVITVGYECTRGIFMSMYSKPHKWIVFDTETTIEYIMEHIKERFSKYKGEVISISEGLTKGATIEL